MSNWMKFSKILEAAQEEHGDAFRVWEMPDGMIYCTATGIVEPDARRLEEGIDYEWDGTIYARI